MELNEDLCTLDATAFDVQNEDVVTLEDMTVVVSALVTLENVSMLEERLVKGRAVNSDAEDLTFVVSAAVVRESVSAVADSVVEVRKEDELLLEGFIVEDSTLVLRVIDDDSLSEESADVAPIRVVGNESPLEC